MNCSHHCTCCGLAWERQASFHPGTVLRGRYMVQRLITSTSLNDVYILIKRPSALLSRVIARAVNPLPPYTDRADLLALQLRLLSSLDTCTQLTGLHSP
jgi:hypothetical protein